MPTKEQCEDHTWVLESLKQSQEADHDMREQAREAHLFVDKRDGQWEPYWYTQNEGKPRYTFDKCNPIIDQIAGDMENADFSIRVSPAGGDATKDLAKAYDGLVRNIHTISNANNTYNRAGREVITAGLDGWRVDQKYVDGDSFDQDLVIEKIPNFLDRVWFGSHNEPDASDAQIAFVLTGLDQDEFKEDYPDSDAGASVGSDRDSQAYYYRRDQVMVGEFLYLKPVTHTLIKMSDQKIYEDDEDYVKVADELAAAGIVEEGRRARTKHVVYSRLFSTDGWLSEPRETVFENWLPVIPCYANFKISEDKVIYWGVVEKLMDAQRVLNYSMSREIEEGALSPRAKYWMTEEQSAGHEDELATLNTNSDPMQHYNHQPENPGPPMQQGGAQINPGLRTISMAVNEHIGQTAGMFAASMGDNPNAQSGIAIEALQSKGATGNNKYLEARQVSQAHTARILVDAIPRIYGRKRQVRLLDEDGSFEMATIGEEVFDNETQEMVSMHDLSQGTYDVVCTFGPSYKNRQNETVSVLTEIAKADPTLLQLGGDIMLNNISSPGMTQLAERKRRELFKAGVIPKDQLTDEERQEIAQQQEQPPQEDPMMVAARAEEAKAQADMVAAQTDQIKAQGDIQIQSGQLEVKGRELDIREFEAETDRYKAEISRGEAEASVGLKGSQAAKALAEAEAQDIENTTVETGLADIITRLGRVGG